jgi:hypothetical protein
MLSVKSLLINQFFVRYLREINIKKLSELYFP